MNISILSKQELKYSTCVELVHLWEIVLWNIVTYWVSNKMEGVHTCGLWRGHTLNTVSGAGALPAAPLSRVQCRLDNVLRHLYTLKISLCHDV